MPDRIQDPYVDVEFESDLQDVAERLIRLRKMPLSLPAYKNACVSIRRTKLLLKSLSRFHGGDRLDGSRLIALACEARDLAKAARAQIPPPLQQEFQRILIGLNRHASELQAARAE